MKVKITYTLDLDNAHAETFTDEGTAAEFYVKNNMEKLRDAVRDARDNLLYDGTAKIYDGNGNDIGTLLVVED